MELVPVGMRRRRYGSQPAHLIRLLQNILLLHRVTLDWARFNRSCSWDAVLVLLHDSLHPVTRCVVAEDIWTQADGQAMFSLPSGSSPSYQGSQKLINY